MGLIIFFILLIGVFVLAFIHEGISQYLDKRWRKTHIKGGTEVCIYIDGELEESFKVENPTKRKKVDKEIDYYLKSYFKYHLNKLEMFQKRKDIDPYYVVEVETFDISRDDIKDYPSFHVEKGKAVWDKKPEDEERPEEDTSTITTEMFYKFHELDKCIFNGSCSKCPVENLCDNMSSCGYTSCYSCKNVRSCYTGIKFVDDEGNAVDMIGTLLEPKESKDMENRKTMMLNIQAIVETSEYIYDEVLESIKMYNGKAKDIQLTFPGRFVNSPDIVVKISEGTVESVSVLSEWTEEWCIGQDE